MKPELYFFKYFMSIFLYNVCGNHNSAFSEESFSRAVSPFTYLLSAYHE